MALEPAAARRRKVLQGRVISDKMDKTVVVEVETRRRNPRYRRVVRHRSRFKAHDDANACHTGDVVRIRETRPLSKAKRWRVIEVVARSRGAELPPAESTAGEVP